MRVSVVVLALVSLGLASTALRVPQSQIIRAPVHTDSSRQTFYPFEKFDVNVKINEYIVAEKLIPPAVLTTVVLLCGASSASAVDTVASVLTKPDLFTASGIALYSKYFLAGGICASFSHGVGVPFDVVKTRLQVSSGPEYAKSNVFSVAKTIIAEEGVGMIFKGMGPTLVGYLIQGSLKYGWYEVFKPIAAAFLASEGVSSDGSGKLLSFMLAGAVAEFIGSTFLCPFEASRIRMVANPTFADGVVGCIAKMVNEETIESLFRGLPAILAKQIPYTVVQLSTYEYITNSVYSYLASSGWESAEVAPYRFGISAAAALVAAVLSSLASQPGDTLLSVVNKSARSQAAAAVGAVYTGGSDDIDNSSSSSSNNNLKSITSTSTSLASSTDAGVDNIYSTSNGSGNARIAAAGVAAVEGAEVSTADDIPPAQQGTLAIMVETINELGIQGLFKGTKARLFHMITIVVTQLLVYDFVKQLCGIPATGVH